MNALRIPQGVWGWRGTALVLLLLLAPMLAVVQLVPDARSLPTAAALKSGLVAIGSLAAAVALYLHTRVTANNQGAWLSVALSVGGIPMLAYAAYSFAHPTTAQSQLTWVLVFRVATTMVMLGLVLVSSRIRLRVDALALGLLVGLALAVGRQLVVLDVEPLPTPPHLRLVVGLLLLACAVGIGVCVLRIAELPYWLRVRCVVALAILTLAAAIDPAAHTNLTVAILALATGLTGAVLLAGACAAVLHQALSEESRRVSDLEAELARMEVGVRADRARLHEIDSTVAGIASASRLIRNSPHLTDSRRDVLTGMMAAEVERLHRMMAVRSVDRRRRVDLDDVVGHLVALHRTRGRKIDWTPSGLIAMGRADDIAEVVDSLLQNAARHGSPDRIRVTVAEAGRDVEIAVSDEGPGVAAPLRGRIFEWGVRGQHSPGEGIGLSVAHDLARNLGGDLRIDDVPVGARFVLVLPAADLPEGVGPAGVLHVAS